MRVMRLLGYLAAATVVVIAITNISDIRRYIRISTM